MTWDRWLELALALIYFPVATWVEHRAGFRSGRARGYAEGHAHGVEDAEHRRMLRDPHRRPTEKLEGVPHAHD